ncbi:MAG: aminopeptidase [Eubacteriaceae bacterium]|nr:aminopeptidase [Eubacteriaceae bacterium]
METEKTNGNELKDLQKELSYKKTSAWESLDKQAAFGFAQEYKEFLLNKTEREFAKATVDMLKSCGFIDIDDAGELKPNDKVYKSIRGKGVTIAIIGQSGGMDGYNITAAHLDSPRLDLKQIPLYEDEGAALALFKTHYYGGIKKYQWATIPLALHGVIYTKDSQKVEVCIGEDENDPVFVVSDLLVHLASEQMGLKASEVITGEQLNIAIGNMPIEGDGDVSQKIKLNILKILNEKYGIDEDSFITAEIEAVPAGKPRDVGFDSSMIAAYGHDDRVCSFAALKGILSATDPKRTCICILADKEEIGSLGATGLQSRLYENFIASLFAKCNGSYDELAFRRSLELTNVLSMDVDAAYDPTFSSAFEIKNSAVIGSGSAMTKFTGARGKSSSNDADAEYIRALFDLFKKNGVPVQMTELGKVDQGGGGTVAFILAQKGSNTVDYGVPVLSMHAPMEVISKVDLYSAYQGAKAFYESDIVIKH